MCFAETIQVKYIQIAKLIYARVVGFSRTITTYRENPISCRQPKSIATLLTEEMVKLRKKIVKSRHKQHWTQRTTVENRRLPAKYARNFLLNRTNLSMTTLLTHTVAHSTKPSFRPKTNNQPLKMFLSLALSRAKVVKNWT